jgi:hypothetical protein
MLVRSSGDYIGEAVAVDVASTYDRLAELTAVGLVGRGQLEEQATVLPTENVSSPGIP